MMDDILAFGSTTQENDRRLHAVLERLKEAKITHNPGKCVLHAHPSSSFARQLEKEGFVQIMTRFTS